MARPRLVTTEQMVAALDSSRSLRDASNKLGTWHGAITMRREPEIIQARNRMIARRGHNRVRRVECAQCCIVPTPPLYDLDGNPYCDDCAKHWGNW